MAITLDLKFRPFQAELHRRLRRFNVLVCHRRFGKTVFCLGKLLEDALTTKRKRWQGAYLAPTYRQAKNVAWAYLKDYVRALPGVDINESELRITFAHNGATLRLLSGENYDALRGMYLDAAVLDETALIPPVAWTMVIRPMLADRMGWAIFIGTPAGRQNLFFEQLEFARSEAESAEDATSWDLHGRAMGGQGGDWSWAVLPQSVTGILDASEVASMRRGMSPEEFSQELECSFNAAIRGAYYAKAMAALGEAGHITSVQYDSSLAVSAALDLGFSDAMVAWFWQEVGNEVRLIDCRAYEQCAIPEMVADWRDLPHRPRSVIAPHDVKVHELSTGRTREEVFQELGLEVIRAPNIGLHEGIDQVRRFLPLCWFDERVCRIGIEALNSYRSDYDEVRRAHRMQPLHDWSSHYADAFRMLAVAKPIAGRWGAPIDYSRQERRAI